jgi:hypothetical protein
LIVTGSPGEPIHQWDVLTGSYRGAGLVGAQLTVAKSPQGHVIAAFSDQNDDIIICPLLDALNPQECDFRSLRAVSADDPRHGP